MGELVPITFFGQNNTVAARNMAGADSFGLSDPIGFADPAQIKRMFARLSCEIGAAKMANEHLHNPRDLGLANLVAAPVVDVTTFDFSLGGFGGSSYVQGATGNNVTNDPVFMPKAMGLHTIVDVDVLIAVREVLPRVPPDEAIYFNVPEMGLPKRFA